MYPTTLTAMLTQVNFLLKLTPPHLTLEKVKKVKVGRRRREGWWVMILRELLLLRLRVEKMARRHCGQKRRMTDRVRSIGLNSWNYLKDKMTGTLVDHLVNWTGRVGNKSQTSSSGRQRESRC